MRFRAKPRDIDKAVTEMRRRLAERANTTPADRCYVRLAQFVLPAFIRWQMTEINNDTSPADIGEAHVQVTAWLMAQVLAALPEGEERATALDVVADMVKGQAIAFLQGGRIVGGDLETAEGLA